MKRNDLLAFVYLVLALIPLALFLWDFFGVLGSPREVDSLRVGGAGVAAWTEAAAKRERVAAEGLAPQGQAAGTAIPSDKETSPRLENAPSPSPEM